MVLLTENPILRLASCCSVEVVNGAAGVLVAGFCCTSSTLNLAFCASAKSACAAFLSESCWFNSAVNKPLSLMNCPWTRKNPSVLNLSISRSRSTINLTATDWTRPAERLGRTFFQRTGESSKPTMRSSTRRACCASTSSWLIWRGFSMARVTAVLVISLKVMRLVSFFCSSSVSYKCQEIASPSRSSSVASHTVSAAFANFLSSATTCFLSGLTSYCGVKLASRSIAIPFLARSRTCP